MPLYSSWLVPCGLAWSIDGVVVDVLRAVDDVQAVERGLGAFGEHGVDVVAHQRAAERNGVRGEVGAAAELRLHGGDVERVGGFLLHLVVIHHGAFAGHDFGDGVGEVACPRPCSVSTMVHCASAPTRISVRGCTATGCAAGRRR